MKFALLKSLQLPVSPGLQCQPVKPISGLIVECRILIQFSVTPILLKFPLSPHETRTHISRAEAGPPDTGAPKPLLQNKLQTQHLLTFFYCPYLSCPGMCLLCYCCIIGAACLPLLQEHMASLVLVCSRNEDHYIVFRRTRLI